jgi:general secretion pathway protein N
MLARHDIATSLLLTAAAILFCGREALTKPLVDGDAPALEVLVTTKQAELTDSLGRTKTPNPLWTVPLGTLSQTRKRPLFSPSRRPPAPPVVVDVPAPLVTAPKPAAPDRLGLLLIGTVLGHLNIAILRQENTEILLRLHAGQDHEGWILRRIDRRDVTFEKGQDTAVLTLSNPMSEQMIRTATADERPNAITRFAMPTPEPDVGTRCVSGLTARTLPNDSALCAVGRGRALFRSSSN